MDFIHHDMTWSTVPQLSFPPNQHDVNMLILVVGTATPRTLQSRVSACFSRPMAGVGCFDVAMGNDILQGVDIHGARSVG